MIGVRATAWLACALLSIGAARAGNPLAPADPVRAFERHSVQAIRDAHAGQAFVLAMWSVYCEPCRDELATLGRFKAAHPHVPVVLVAADPPEDAEAIRAMLAQYDLAGVETWAFADAFVERLRYAVDPRWRGELPRTYFYDAEHRASAVSGRIDAVQLSDWLDRTAPSH